MTALPRDPLDAEGIRGFARRLRAGETTSEATTRACVERIEALDARLGAFQHVAADGAIKAARALDRLLAAGTDLGPLMGIPVGVKDIFAVDGMPTTAGSTIEVGDLIGAEGSFVRALRRAGCVILGKTKTVEFALGATGISQPRGTPWNPWDPAVHRIPGGSSSGSAVATAAGLCAFAIGTDTGGSVRLPATFCGIFGLKSTVGLWPLDGVFPLSRTLDSIGPLTRSAADAALVYAALTGAPEPLPAPAGSVRLGHPGGYFYDDLEPDIARCTEAALAELERVGVEIVPVEVPEAREREDYFPLMLPADLISVLGRERYLTSRDAMDPVVSKRSSRGLDLLATDYLRLDQRRRELCRIAGQRLAGLDGWVTPSAAILPPALSDFDEPARGLELTFSVTRNSQPGNLFGLCGTSTPIHQLGAPLPVGLQVLGRAGGEARALSVARLLEEVLGAPTLPDLSGFL